MARVSGMKTAPTWGGQWRGAGLRPAGPASRPACGVAAELGRGFGGCYRL